MTVFVPTRPINGENLARIGGPMDPVTGDAPQPGETPPKESNPWTFSDPDNAFWRGAADRETEGRPVAGIRAQRGPAAQSATLTPPVSTDPASPRPAEAAQAQAAAVRDVTEQLVDGGQRPDGVERDHDQVDEQRFNPKETPLAYATTTPESAATEPPVHSAEPPGDDADGVPEIMVLPEPSANRPTVVLDRGPVPGQPPTGLSRLSQAQSRRPSPLLETSPFWLTDAEREERAAAGPAPETHPTPRAIRRRRTRPPRRPATGLFGLVALALIAAFFAWVSAEPFWLAVGHGDTGVATVTRCTGDGVTQRCAGRFEAAGGQYVVSRVTLLGVEPGHSGPGAVSPARMVSPHSRQAYVGDGGLLVQLRWVLGVLLVLICGLGSAALTGTHRLPTAGARRTALILSLSGPLLLLVGFLYVAY